MGGKEKFPQKLFLKKALHKKLFLKVLFLKRRTVETFESVHAF